MEQRSCKELDRASAQHLQDERVWGGGPATSGSPSSAGPVPVMAAALLGRLLACRQSTQPAQLRYFEASLLPHFGMLQAEIARQFCIISKEVQSFNILQYMWLIQLVS